MLGSDTCFVLMPFGRKANPFPGPSQIDFDIVYEKLIKRAVEAASLRPLRADQEISGGLIHLSMFERLLLCEYAVADLTTANANVYYELGIRHAVRPWSTVLICGSTSRLPFDVEDLRTWLYSIGDDGSLSNNDSDAEEIRKRLEDVRQKRTNAEPQDDSPLFTLLKQHGYLGPDLTRLQNTLDEQAGFLIERERVRRQLASAATTLADLHQIQDKYNPSDDANASIAMELFMSYRRLAAWDDMIALLNKLPEGVRDSVSVQEQYGMALGRKGDFAAGEQVLQKLIAKRGPTALTYCFLGVLRKLRLVKAIEDGNQLEAHGALNNAISAFLTAFKLEPRMIFAGINSVLLMEVRDPDGQELQRIKPVVRYFIHDSLATGKAGFWEHVAALELAVLEDNLDKAAEFVDLARVDSCEPWMPVSVLANIKLIREAREKRGTAKPWYAEVEKELDAMRGNAKAAGIV